MTESQPNCLNVTHANTTAPNVQVELRTYLCQRQPRRHSGMTAVSGAGAKPKVTLGQRLRTKLGVKLGKKTCIVGRGKQAERLFRADSRVYSHLITAAAVQENVIPTLKRKYTPWKRHPGTGGRSEGRGRRGAE